MRIRKQYLTPNVIHSPTEPMRLEIEIRGTQQELKRIAFKINEMLNGLE